jgi:hypothetical protein
MNSGVPPSGSDRNGRIVSVTWLSGKPQKRVPTPQIKNGSLCPVLDDVA